MGNAGRSCKYYKENLKEIGWELIRKKKMTKKEKKKEVEEERRNREGRARREGRGGGRVRSLVIWRGIRVRLTFYWTTVKRNRDQWARGTLETWPEAVNSEHVS